MRIIFLLLSFIFVFSSCNKNKIYDDFESNFEMNRWEENDIRIFEFENMQP
jgi:hypothetical protein